MTTETPHERCTRLIEQYVLKHFSTIEHSYDEIAELVDQGTRFADAVIAATPQEPLPVYDPIPSEAETRLIELCEECISTMNLTVKAPCKVKLAAIKRDLGLT